MILPDWDLIRDLTDRSSFWEEFIQRDELGSTNSFIRKRPELKPGTIVLASRQKHGHGKGKRKWYSPRGGLWFSFLVDCLPTSSSAEFYVVVLKLIKDLLSDYGVEARISRPNDLIAGEGKIAGMLIQESDDNYIIGIGINVNNAVSSLPESIEGSSTTMKELTGERVELAELLRDFMVRFGEYYERI